MKKLKKLKLTAKSLDNDGLHYRQPWVIGVQQEVERLKLKVLRHENLLESVKRRNRLKCWSSWSLNLRLAFKLNRILVREHSC
ncbi:hypothetical protein Bca52824_026855 [Brassica carinata]|uniref:Uncharacterized protein n=1 Tax=Brassica carinata TaxID=52824 RepID=A0A8X7SJA1_BRACI|nr:hypothetical protein Bca52824_026855 [Brassica carinata]